jgi:hypothetical protein
MFLFAHSMTFYSSRPLNTWIAEQSKKASEAQAEFEQKKKEAEAPSGTS